MRLIRKTYADIPQSYRMGAIQSIIKQFMYSDMEAAEVEHTWSGKTNGASVLKASIKRMKLAGVTAIIRNGKTYLVKTKE